MAVPYESWDKLSQNQHHLPETNFISLRETHSDPLQAREVASALDFCISCRLQVTAAQCWHIVGIQ